MLKKDWQNLHNFLINCSVVQLFKAFLFSFVAFLILAIIICLFPINFLIWLFNERCFFDTWPYCEIFK